MSSNLELPEQKNGTHRFKVMQWSKRIKRLNLSSKPTVEPLVLCYSAATMICSPALLVLEFEKACKANEGYEDYICDNIVNSEISNYTEESQAIQIRIANMHSWLVPLQYVMPVLLVLFLGSYSDRHKMRKPFLLLPILGELLAVIGCILCVVFMRTWPLEVQGVLQTVVPSFFGGPSMLFMAAFAYIADISTVEMRTLRIGIVQFLLTFCSTVVQSFSGKLFVTVGYYWVLCFGGLLFFLGLYYGIVFIKEPKQPIGLDDKKGLIKDIFDPRNAIETFNLLLKKKKGNNRGLIVLLMINLFISIGVTQGELSVFYLFVVTVYQWTVVEYSIFGTINTVIHLIGTAVFVPLFSNVLKLSDILIAILTFLNKVLCNIIFAVYLKPVGLYIGTVISIISPIAGIAIRSQATKIVNPDDLGKAQSLFSIMEALAPAAFGPLYNTGIYTNTITVFPSAFFLVGALLHAIGAILLLIMFKLSMKRKQVAQRAEHMQAYAYENQTPDIIEVTHM